MHDHCSLITVVVHISLVSKLIEFLNSIGIKHLYSTLGRSVILNDRRNFFSFFGNSDLESEPVELLYFYLPTTSETKILKLIAQFCRLDIPGRGSVFAKQLKRQAGIKLGGDCKLDQTKVDEILTQNSINIFSNLTQINCTLSKGLGDEVARLLLHLGIVPTISNASGTGLRDKLGLLRITIPKEKEFLSVVVGNNEANAVMDRIIQWGKLDRPGRGFVWQVPVSQGLINFKTSQKSIGQAASTEQIIAAIDSLKGSLSWRQGGSNLAGKSNRIYFRGNEFYIHIDEGGSLNISKEMLKLGINGATVRQLKTLVDLDNEEDNIVIPKEIIQVIVTDNQTKKVIENFISNENKQLENINMQIFSINVNRAFNFRPPK